MPVQSLVKELRSHMPRGQKNRKQKQYSNKFNKDFKNGPYKKIFKRRDNARLPPRISEEAAGLPTDEV